jgi:hypothetical protein
MANLIDTDAKIQGEDPAGFGQQHIVSTSGGDLYTVMINDIGDIEVHESTDGGSNWTLDTTFSSLISVRNLSLAVAENDDIFLCFLHNTTTIIVKKRSFGSGGAWSEVESLSGIGTPYPIISYNRSVNRLHLIWSNNDSPYLAHQYSDNKGNSWTIADLITAGLSSAVHELWAVDTEIGSGDINCFFTTKDTRRFNSSGGSTSPSIEGTLTGTILAGAIVTDSSDNRWRASYRDDSGTFKLDIYLNGSVDLAVSFGATDELLHGNLSMCIDGSDNIFVFYSKRADNDTYYRRYDKATDTWESEVQLTSTGIDGIRPSVEQHPGNTGNLGNLVFYSS